ncbi:MAG TPA: HD domain-containing phosphohydrolase [Solirubrobacteraceae bacterium]|nr:HD domain-containing phosphohydrolase [Solirubrobacteraceae bacterium]
MRRFNPFTGLRPRIAALVLGGVLVLAAIMVQVSAHSSKRAYERAADTELSAIATTWEDGFDVSDLADPQLMQQRVQVLQEQNPHLTKIAVSWEDVHGNTRVAEAGIDRTAGHRAEIRHPVGTDAMLEIDYDLAALDHARAADARTMWLIALGAALLLGALVSVALGRTVVRRLDRVRAVANRLRDGDNAARTNLGGADEIGVLARDFDRMADALLEALKDPLTGLLNHRAFQERLAEELRRAERGAYPVALVAIDLDDFKSINGAGHAVGDEALRAVAAALRDELRAGDVCGRVGGDEFMIALIDADVGMADAIVERIRERVDAAFSAGIVAYPQHGTGQDELLHLAHGAMYWAKSHGKARTFVYSDAIDFALSAEEAAERNLRAGLLNTVHALARAVDAKDGYTHSHSQRVARYAAELGRALGLPEERLEMLRTAGVLHDVGKIGIPDAVLLKPAKLDDDEFAVMRRHSELGRDIIAGAGLGEIATWVLHLHERFDGRGYPAALVAEEIPLESRILHCADALEAMTSSRIYRPGMETERALAELERGAGTQFDPHVAAVLVDLVRAGVVLTDRTSALSRQA